MNLQYWQPQDFNYMRQALVLAQQGAQQGEVPVGAVLVHDNQVIGSGFNQPICSSDPTAHAEVVALRRACNHLQNYRLPTDTTLYVTLEPCTMCVGALIHARVTRLIFATHEPRAGMVGSRLNLPAADYYNHTIQVSSGLLADHSQRLLKDFFRQRRAQR
ncbi:tRNA adenosine(34) deaminase TadA [Psychrobacter sp. I-STPA10]|uniref:tRNA adenosine(34) deaminase TadA n=1 Tax=Psychrobacter sp. I-STPA10 TaxID=2585769 RepID=UPI001E395987|nr:tRNA adenosine(34) deaminase TadA [Psychrobacter sp. I-STPA10]